MNKPIIISVIIIALIGAGLFISQKPRNNTNLSDNPQNNIDQNVIGDMSEANAEAGFSGEKGETITLVSDVVAIDSSVFETNKVKFFNTTLSSGKTVYYLILKDKEGNYRVAANANEQCAQFGKGYRQVGDQLICITCQKSYSINDFAIAQPDCNPKPINPKASLQNNQVIISSTELEKVSYLF